jgi:hypothetical protein
MEIAECLVEDRTMDEQRKRLLIELEDIIGNEFYNANIQNWGPGGVFKGAGRALRYPVTFHDKERGNFKTKDIDKKLPAETIITGSYRLGANELGIMRAIDRVLVHLERHHGVTIGNAKN